MNFGPETIEEARNYKYGPTWAVGRYREGRCIASVPDDTGFFFRQCSRKIWRDGFCRQHHPESYAKRMREREARENPDYQIEAMKRGRQA